LPLLKLKLRLLLKVGIAVARTMLIEKCCSSP
jgi:hypothetical protein